MRRPKRRSLRPISVDEMVSRGPVVLVERWIERDVEELLEIRRKLETIERSIRMRKERLDAARALDEQRSRAPADAPIGDVPPHEGETTP